MTAQTLVPPATRRQRAAIRPRFGTTFCPCLRTRASDVGVGAAGVIVLLLVLYRRAGRRVLGAATRCLFVMGLQATCRR